MKGQEDSHSETSADVCCMYGKQYGLPIMSVI
jgi:hypothetical protein